MLSFARHFTEMVIAMLVGMVVLGAPLVLAGVDLDGSPAAALLGMAAVMTAPMVAWMRFRGHGWAPCADMTAAMFLPSLLAIALGGTLDLDEQMAVQHTLMLPAMLAAMLLRRSEYV